MENVLFKMQPVGLMRKAFYHLILNNVFLRIGSICRRIPSCATTIVFTSVFFLDTPHTHAQKNDTAIVNSLFAQALRSDIAYEQLRRICKETGPRLCGSKQSLEAVKLTQGFLSEMKLDTVYLQEVTVPHWDRGEKEKGCIISKSHGTENVNVCAIGGSIGTSKKGLSAEIIEVESFEQLEIIGKEKINGKIVFFNREMDSAIPNPFYAYGAVAGYRFSAAKEAAKFGATAVIVRSLTLVNDTFPHTGIMRYETGRAQIPAACICTQHAALLSKRIKEEPGLKFGLEMNCRLLPDEISYNVIGELTGSEFPDEYIIVGGHLDSWDNSEGAHDDGAGCVQSIEVLRLFLKNGIKPRHTIRVVLFMDEEYAQSGGREYARLATLNKEKHIAAIESDAGGTTPVGFTTTGNENIENKLKSWEGFLLHYGLYLFEKGWGGVDIDPLGETGVPLFGLNTDPHRYFEYHHSANDTFEQVHNRELQLGSAAMASLVYLIDTFGF